jgi:hypothetical protein
MQHFPSFIAGVEVGPLGVPPLMSNQNSYKQLLEEKKESQDDYAKNFLIN